MRREIEAAALEIVSHGDKDQPPKLNLLRVIKAMVEAAIVDAHLAGLNALQERNQSGTELCEERRELAYRGAGLVGIQQRVIG